jgi:mRNA interferase HigB
VLRCERRRLFLPFNYSTTEYQAAALSCVRLPVPIKFALSKLFVFLTMFNIINRKTLLEYCRKYPQAAVALQEWYYELLRAKFRNFNQLKKEYSSASIVGDDRVVFNIVGNKYRLVVRIVFSYKVIQVKWFGTHKEYDEINVKTIQFKKKK